METRTHDELFDDPENKETTMNEEENRSPLDALPFHTLQTDIGQYLSPLDKKYLAEIGNRYLFSIFRQDIRPTNRQIEQLLLHVVHGEQNEAEAMIKREPRLLLEKRTIEDYSGRKIHGTALQIALGAEDISIKEQQEAMVEMIMRYLKLLPNSELEIAKQWNEQFPAGYEEQEKERAKNDLVALNKVVSAIAASRTDQDCEAALAEFRNYLNPKGIIKTGKHFNAELLVEAFKLYDENYDCFGGWDSRQNNLFWRKVIGYIERFLPACEAQAFCDGLYHVVEKKKPLSRQLKLHIKALHK